MLVENGITGVEVSLSEEEQGLECLQVLSRHFGDRIEPGVGMVIELR